MREIAIDSRDDIHIRRDSRNSAKKVDGAFKGAREETGTGQEEVAYAGGLEVEYRGGTGPFYDLQVDGVEDGADEFAFGGGDVLPEGVVAFYDREPFDACRLGRRGEAVVEEGLERCLFDVEPADVFWD